MIKEIVPWKRRSLFTHCDLQSLCTDKQILELVPIDLLAKSTKPRERFTKMKSSIYIHEMVLQTEHTHFKVGLNQVVPNKSPIHSDFFIPFLLSSS